VCVCVWFIARYCEYAHSHTTWYTHTYVLHSHICVTLTYMCYTHTYVLHSHICVDTPATIVDTQQLLIHLQLLLIHLQLCTKATQLDTLDTLTHMCDTLTQHMREGVKCSTLCGCTYTWYTHTYVWSTHTSHICIKLWVCVSVST